MDKLRILIFGASPFLGSGYGNVVREIATAYSANPKHKVFCYVEGWNATLMKVGNFYILPGQFAVSGGPPRPGPYRAVSCLLKFKPQLAITVGDIVILNWLRGWRQRNQVPWLGYFPVDADPMRVDEIPVAKAIDYPVVTSRFSQRMVRNEGIDCEHIPHGIDTRIYKPIDKNEARDFFKISQDKFMFLYVGTNTRRKNIPILLKAFADNFKDNKDVMLWLHTIRLDGTGWNLVSIIKKMGLDNVYFSPFLDDLAFTLDELAMLYNSADCFVSASSGEGFGLPHLEAMSCGLPQVAVDYSAIPELAEGCGELVPVEYKWMDGFGAYRGMCNSKDFGDRMLKLYNDEELRKKYSKKALEKAKEYDWSKTTPMWLDLLDRIEYEWYK